MENLPPNINQILIENIKKNVNEDIARIRNSLKQASELSPDASLTTIDESAKKLIIDKADNSLVRNLKTYRLKMFNYIYVRQQYTTYDLLLIDEKYRIIKPTQTLWFFVKNNNFVRPIYPKTYLTSACILGLVGYYFPYQKFKSFIKKESSVFIGNPDSIRELQEQKGKVIHESIKSIKRLWKN